MDHNGIIALFKHQYIIITTHHIGVSLQDFVVNFKAPLPKKKNLNSTGSECLLLAVILKILCSGTVY